MRFARATLLSLLAIALGAGVFAGLASGVGEQSGKDRSKRLGEKEQSGKDHSKELEFTKIEPGVVKVKVDEGKRRFNKNRKIVVKYSGAPGQKLQKLGTDKTDRKGVAKLKGSFFVGNYKAILKPKRKSSRRGVKAREEDALVEEEVDEDEDADDARANAAGNGTGTFTTTTE